MDYFLPCHHFELAGRVYVHKLRSHSEVVFFSEELYTMSIDSLFALLLYVLSFFTGESNLQLPANLETLAAIAFVHVGWTIFSLPSNGTRCKCLSAQITRMASNKMVGFSFRPQCYYTRARGMDYLFYCHR